MRTKNHPVKVIRDYRCNDTETIKGKYLILNKKLQNIFEIMRIFFQLCSLNWWVWRWCQILESRIHSSCQRVEQPNLGQTALKYQIDGWSGLACLRFWLRSTDPTKSLWRVPTVRHTHLSGRYLGVQPASGCSRQSVSDSPPAHYSSFGLQGTYYTYCILYQNRMANGIGIAHKMSILLSPSAFKYWIVLPFPSHSVLHCLS